MPHYLTDYQLNLAEIMKERMQLTANEGHWKKQLAKMEDEFCKAFIALNESREKLIVIAPPIVFLPNSQKGLH